MRSLRKNSREGPGPDLPDGAVEFLGGKARDAALKELQEHQRQHGC